VFNEGRCGSVRRWMLRVFGEDYLKSGSGVLDVAGGKGELAFELSALNAVTCTVIDPRPMDLYRYKRKLLFGYYHRNEVLGVYNSVPRPIDHNDIRLPFHIRAFFEVPTLSTCHLQDSQIVYTDGIDLTVNNIYPFFLHDETKWTECLLRGLNTVWTNKGLTHDEVECNSSDSDGDEGACDHSCSCGDDTSSCASSYGSAHLLHPNAGGVAVCEYEHALSLVRDCSMLVGMHPDQAAEQIIDCALRLKKPFCVVPCCKFLYFIR
jgi:hypothetical protein